MRRMRVPVRRVDHLFCIAVVGGDEKDVARFLTGFVDCAHCGVGVTDGFDGGVVDACVADLCEHPRQHVTPPNHIDSGIRREWMDEDGPRMGDGGGWI